jgi:hypothetical protein
MSCTYSNEKIAKDIENTFKLVGIPSFPSLPVPILALGADFRPGLNAKRITSDIISQFSKAGIVNGDYVWEKYTSLLVETLVNAIVYDAKVSVGIKPSGIGTVVGAGGNAGGPVVTTGTNVAFGSATGIIS